MSVTATAKKPTADVDRTGSAGSGRFTIKNLPVFDLSEATKPLLAVVGVADLALEQAKDVPALYVAEARKVSARLADVPEQVRTLPASVKNLRDEVETRVEKVTGRATDVYTRLTVRGERMVDQLRRQPATEAAIAEGKEAVRKAEASAVAAKKSARAGAQAAEDAAGTLG